MVEINKSYANFAGGLLSKKLLGRIDLQTYPLGASVLENIIPEVQGPLTFRPGFRYVLPTRGGGSSRLRPFVFNDSQAYVLEFSDQKLRFFSDGGIITETAVVVSDVTQANPGVVTATSHGYSDGDLVYISGVGGMVSLNGAFYTVANATTHTFTLQTLLTGTDVDTSSYGAYISGGTAERVYEIDTPYEEADLPDIKLTQKADLMYLVHPDFEPRKLIRTTETNWSLDTYTRTSDPFTTSISGATQAAQCEITTSSNHPFEDGDTVEIYSVGGMTELNGNSYTVEDTGADTFKIKDTTTGAYINSSAYGAYTSGGYVFKAGDMPGATGFYGGRLAFGGTAGNPETFWMSRGPQDDGTTRYDDFTTGADADHAVVFPIASHNNTADRIRWFSGNNKFLGIGTYGAVYKAYGETEASPISGSSVNVAPVDFYGCANIAPVRLGTIIFYVQRGKLILNRFAYSFLADGYESDSLNLLSDELTFGGVEELAVQEGTKDIVWMPRDDGRLLGITAQIQEKIAAWHTHKLGGTDVKVLSVCGEPQESNMDHLWAVVERTINGSTERYIEYMSFPSNFPEFEDYYTGTKETDEAKFLKLLWEEAKQQVHLDSALVLDTTQSVAVTPGAVSGDEVIFTAASSLFEDTDVGRRIVKKYLTGEEAGIAEIIAYRSNTEVVCNILETFDSASQIAASAWYLSATEITGLDHLEGETVKVITDGAVHPDETVSGGAITLDAPATVVHVGLGYTGRYTSMPIEAGGLRGPAQTRTMTINKLGLLFRHTLGAKYGTDVYNLSQIVFRTTNDYTDRPPALFTGAKIVNMFDGYENQKFIHILQEDALPCTIQAIIPYVDVTNE